MNLQTVDKLCFFFRWKTSNVWCVYLHKHEIFQLLDWGTIFGGCNPIEHFWGETGACSQ